MNFIAWLSISNLSIIQKFTSSDLRRIHQQSVKGSLSFGFLFPANTIWRPEATTQSKCITHSCWPYWGRSSAVSQSRGKEGGCWKGADPFHRKQGDGRPIRCWISGRSVCPWDGSSGGFHHSDATEPPSREIRAVNSAQASDKSDLRSFEKAIDVFTARLSSGGVLSCSEGSDGDGRGTSVIFCLGVSLGYLDRI